MTLGNAPEKLAQESFEQIDRIAYANRPDPGEATIIVDGSRYSPSTRACPLAEHVYQHGTDEDWEIFSEELDQLVDAYAHGGYSLCWDDGCLWLCSASYMPED